MVFLTSCWAQKVVSRCEDLLPMLTEWRVNLALKKQNPLKTIGMKAETQENDDNELLSTWKHCMYRAVVGMAVHYSDWRPHVQHAVHKNLTHSHRTGAFGSSTPGTLHHLQQGRDTANGAHNCRAGRGVLG